MPYFPDDLDPAVLYNTTNISEDKFCYGPSLEMIESTKVLYEEKLPYNLNPFTMN